MRALFPDACVPLHKDVLGRAEVPVSMKLTSSQDRDAVGRWIEGQADRVEGRRILAELPRLARGEGYVWAPSGGVLARVAFPSIRTFDNSRTPQRGECAAAPRTPAELDLPAIAAALAEMEAPTADPAAVGRKRLSELDGRLSLRDRELAATRARVAELEAEAAAMQARLERAEERGARATPAAAEPEQPATGATGAARQSQDTGLPMSPAGGDAAGATSKRSVNRER